jgi:integrase/recombinase XerD
MEQAKVDLQTNFKSDETKCPRCESLNYKKQGKRNGKQRYQCKDCHRKFTENIPSQINPGKHLRANYVLPKSISANEMKKYDVWDLRVLGKKPSQTRGFGLNFSEIHPNWLKEATKDYIWFQVSRRETGTLIRYVYTINLISSFMQKFNFLHPNEIDRKFVIDLINYISFDRKATTIGNYISVFKDFFDFCQENNTIPKDQGKLIFDDDYPKRNKSLVKDIPGYVLKQIKEKLDVLPQPISLIVEILMETGMRVSEVCILQLNCIEQDSDGDWWIRCIRKKLKKENRLFVSKELAIKIQDHQRFIKNTCDNNFNNLFCTTEG